MEGAEPVWLTLHFSTWSASCSDFLDFWQPWQTLLIMSTSRDLPVSLEIPVTQPFNDEHPRLCYVPSQDPPHRTISSSLLLCISFDEFLLAFSAAVFIALDEASLVAK